MAISGGSLVTTVRIGVESATTLASVASRGSCSNVVYNLWHLVAGSTITPSSLTLGFEYSRTLYLLVAHHWNQDCLIRQHSNSLYQLYAHGLEFLRISHTVGGLGTYSPFPFLGPVPQLDGNSLSPSCDTLLLTAVTGHKHLALHTHR